MTGTTKRAFMPKVETKLRQQDFKRLDDLAKTEGKTKSEVLREAALFYLDAVEQQKFAARESEISQSIDAMTNRVCAMLARQGRQLGAMFELTYSSMSQTKEGRQAWEAAVTTANQKQRRTVMQDEREVVEAMKKRVKDGTR